MWPVGSVNCNHDPVVFNFHINFGIIVLVSGCGCFKNRKTFSPYMTDRCASYDEEENYSFTINPYSGSGLQTCPPNTIFNYEVCDCQLDWFVDCPSTCHW